MGNIWPIAWRRGGSYFFPKIKLIPYWRSNLLSTLLQSIMLAITARGLPIYIYIYIYMEYKVIFKWSLTDLSSSFSFSYTGSDNKDKEHNIHYYLPIVGGRIIQFIHLARLLALCELQTASSSIWTRLTVSIFYSNNHCTTRASALLSE